MRASEFYKIIVDEKSTVQFLQLYNLLPNDRVKRQIVKNVIPKQTL